MNYSSNLNYNLKQQYNGSYSVLYLLPFLLCHKKQILRWAAIGLSVFIVMISLKRGGFIAVLFASIVYFYINYISMSGKKIKLVYALLLIIAGIGLFLLVNYVNDIILGDLLYERMNSTDEGSGRLSIYQSYFNFFFSDDFLHVLIGHGWLGSMLDSGLKVSTHNDFLEVIVDFGLIGFIAYIAFWLSLIKIFRIMIKNKHEYAPAMGASIAIFLVNSMVSHIFVYSWFMIEFGLFWGFSIGSVYSPERESVIKGYIEYK